MEALWYMIKGVRRSSEVSFSRSAKWALRSVCQVSGQPSSIFLQSLHSSSASLLLSSFSTTNCSSPVSSRPSSWPPCILYPVRYSSGISIWCQSSFMTISSELTFLYTFAVTNVTLSPSLITLFLILSLFLIPINLSHFICLYVFLSYH